MNNINRAFIIISIICGICSLALGISGNALSAGINGICAAAWGVIALLYTNRKGNQR